MRTKTGTLINFSKLLNKKFRGNL